MGGVLERCIGEGKNVVSPALDLGGVAFAVGHLFDLQPRVARTEERGDAPDRTAVVLFAPLRLAGAEHRQAFRLADRFDELFDEAFHFRRRTPGVDAPAAEDVEIVLCAARACLRQRLDIGIDPGHRMTQFLTARADRARNIARVAAERGVGEEDAHDCCVAKLNQQVLTEQAWEHSTESLICKEPCQQG